MNHKSTAVLSIIFVTILLAIVVLVVFGGKEAPAQIGEGFSGVVSETLEPQETYGFLVDLPEWGVFSVEDGSSSQSCYVRGSFEHQPNVAFRGSSSECISEYGRGAGFTDVIGFRELEEGYELFISNGVSTIVPEDQVLGLFLGGDVLVIEGKEATGPNLLPSVNSIGVVLNLNDELIDGGVFIVPTEVLSKEEITSFILSLELN